MKLTGIAFVLSCAALGAAQAPPAKPHDAEVVTAVKQTPVSQLDQSLPRISFEKWMRAEAGTDAKISWDVIHCGSQAQTANDSAVCVGADAQMKDGRSIMIMVAVDKPGAKQPPRVYFIQLITPAEARVLNHLGDLVVALFRPGN